MKFEYSPYIAVQVKDFKNAIDFYQRVLGIEFNYTKDNDTYLKSGMMNFVFENAPVGAHKAVFFEFKVKNMKEARELLEKEGCIVTREYIEKNMMFSDPYGMNFHIFEEGTFEDT